MEKPKIEEIIGADIPLHGKGKELHSYCPFCSSEKSGKSDRFVVWTDKQRFWCRQCNQSGDVIQYVILRDNLHNKMMLSKNGDYVLPAFIQACEVLGIALEGDSKTSQRKTTPKRARQEDKRLSEKRQIGFNDTSWQFDAKNFVETAQEHLLLHATGEKGREYLRSRGLETGWLWGALGLGYNPHDFNGFFGDKEIWLPRGIVIPYYTGRNVVKVNIRSMSNKTNKKYVQASGSANTLYAPNRLYADVPAVLVESEIDALSIIRAVHDPRHITPVATGSVSSSRIIDAVAMLSICPKVYIALDTDEAGEKASEWWLSVLPNAVRLRPTEHDVNDMLLANVNIREWIGI